MRIVSSCGSTVGVERRFGLVEEQRRCGRVLSKTSGDVEDRRVDEKADFVVLAYETSVVLWAIYITECDAGVDHVEERNTDADREAGRQLQLDEALQAREVCVSNRHQVDDGKYLLLSSFYSNKHRAHALPT